MACFGGYPVAQLQITKSFEKKVDKEKSNVIWFSLCASSTSLGFPANKKFRKNAKIFGRILQTFSRAFFRENK